MSAPVAALEVAQPLALWGLLLAVPLVVLHLVFRRRRRLVVPFAALLQESLGPVRSAARFRRVQDRAALAARLLALLCGVLALAGLRPAAAQQQAEDVFLVIDADVTTAVREEGGVLRLARGLELARAWVRALPAVGSGDPRLAGHVAVLLAERHPRLLVAPTRDRGLALGRLAQPAAPAPGRADLDAALRTAVDAAAGRPGAHVVVLTSRPLAVRDADPSALRAGVDVTVQGIGRARDDQGMVAFSVARADDGAGYAVQLAVRNEMDAPRTRRLDVRVAGETVAHETLSLEAGATLPVSLSVPAPRAGAWLTVALEGEDAFPANDVVEARLAPLPVPSLLVVHGGRVRPYTAAVATALAQAGLVDPARSGSVAVADLDRAEPRDIVLVDGTALPAGRLVPGAYVFLAPLSGALPFEAGPVVESPLVWRTVEGHPLVRDLDLRRAYVARGRAVEGAGLVPLAWAEGRPVLAEGERAGVRYVVLALDPEGSALPVQAALPLLIRRAVLRLARAPSVPLAAVYRPGEALRPRAALPGGPEARVAWAGPPGDPTLAPLWRSEAPARLDPQGVAWPVPAGASGRARIVTRPREGPPWTGEVAFVDVDPARSVVPVRPVGAAPAASPARVRAPVRWRRGLLAAALLLLLADLGLLARARRPRQAPAASHQA